VRHGYHDGDEGFTKDEMWFEGPTNEAFEELCATSNKFTPLNAHRG
jgi:hypothetical protein